MDNSILDENNIKTIKSLERLKSMRKFILFGSVFSIFAGLLVSLAFLKTFDECFLLGGFQFIFIGFATILTNRKYIELYEIIKKLARSPGSL